MNNPLVQPDPGLFIWTIITFLVLLGLLAKFAWKPLLKALENRQETIRKSLDDAQKAKEELERLQNESAQIIRQARIDKAHEEGWAEHQMAQAVGELWIRESKQLVKIWLPPVVLGVGSIACVLAAHGILKRQQGALVAAYAALDATLRTYRERVREELGEEKELELYRTRNNRSYEGVDETGQPCIINEDDPRIGSQYGKFFDDTSNNWTKNPEYNRAFLLGQQQYANDRLKAYGYLFLNDVYEALGLKRTQAGQVVGWRLKKFGGIDGYVDFGLDLIYDEMSRAFTNGHEATVFLDFNVDGPITVIE